MSELKNCPFCGSKKEKPMIIEQGQTRNGLHRSEYYVKCFDCGIMTINYNTKKEAITAWNARSEPEARALTLDELREMDGKSVWVKEIEEWAIVIVDTVGQYKNMPFVQGSNFDYDVAFRKLTRYDKEPKGE